MMQTIKTRFSRGENGNPQDRAISDTTFRLPNGLHKPLNKLSSKDLSRIILYDRTVQIPSKLYWLHKFYNIDNKWMVWFEMNLVNGLLLMQCRDFNWKLFHGQINTESRLQRMSLWDGECKICCIHVENLDHLLYECEGVVKVWEEIQNIVITAFNINLTVDLLCVLAGVWEDY